MTQDGCAWLDEVLAGCLREQFPEFEITPGELPERPSSLVGQIGFLTKEGRGSLGVVAESRTLTFLEPEIGGRVLDVADWIGELANQTLGRIKTRIGSPMMGIVTTTPIVLREACLCIGRSDEVRTFQLEREGNCLSVWIDLTSIDTRSEAAPLASSEQPIRAGEAALFF